MFAVARLRNRAPTAFQALSVVHSARFYRRYAVELQHYILRARAISTTQFSFNFNSLTDAMSLSLFRFRKEDVVRMVRAIAWPGQWTKTKRNRYACDPILVTCLILRRVSSPARWVDMEVLFGRHGSQMSEIFWEGLEHFLDVRQYLMTGEISATFVRERAPMYAAAINDRSQAR